jgi:hypothetical protein
VPRMAFLSDFRLLRNLSVGISPLFSLLRPVNRPNYETYRWATCPDGNR